ncbi:MAG TPA: PPA1309 family protein, partial [Candidatus Limnocylindrales bacterium]|nr:PPA1309 family protein [Candidatus Limnocylindrales bacterium]
ALVVERIVLPPEAEAAVADRPDAAAVAREHPAAQAMRIVVAVTKDGQQVSVLRLRGAPGADGSPPSDAEDSVLTGHDLVPGLAEALIATFR